MVVREIVVKIYEKYECLEFEKVTNIKIEKLYKKKNIECMQELGIRMTEDDVRKWNKCNS